MTLASDRVAEQLISKIRFAHDRWGATLFYLDSTVDKNGSPLSSSVLQQVAQVFPDSLLIPEESSPKAHAYVARFSSFLFHGDVGTDPAVYSYYPKAFSVNMINDVAPDKLAAARGALQDSVAHGDILLVHAAFWQPNNSIVQAMYSDAKPQEGGDQGK